MKRIILYISLFICTVAYAQSEKDAVRADTQPITQKYFDADHIEAYKQLDDFKYEKGQEKENFFQIFWNWVKRVVKNILSFFFDDIAPAVGFLALLLRTLPWIVALIALYFIIKFFLKIDTKTVIEGKTRRTVVQISEEEELLLKQDLKILIKEAVTAKNFRLAVRYYYLYNLQKLSDKELIVWQQEKTNEDYIKELTHKHIRPDFIETTRLYDFVWYGNFNINEAEFHKAETLFNQLTSKIIG